MWEYVRRSHNITGRHKSVCTSEGEPLLCDSCRGWIIWCDGEYICRDCMKTFSLQGIVDATGDEPILDYDPFPPEGVVI